MERVSFHDDFSEVSAGYARYRPTYPPELYALIARYAPARNRAWDCATGSGQAAYGLRQHFRSVIATDASREQIEHARPASNIQFRVAPAEATGLDAASMDVVTVATALHWLDYRRFYDEVRRVCRPGAILAAWSYFGVTLSFSPRVDAVMQELTELLLDFWPPVYACIKQDFHDHGAYFRSLEFPFEPLPTPGFELRVHWDLSELLGVLSTASPTRRCLASGARPQLEALFERMAEAWGDPAEKKTGMEPLALRIGRVT